MNDSERVELTREEFSTCYLKNGDYSKNPYRLALSEGQTRISSGGSYKNGVYDDFTMGRLTVFSGNPDGTVIALVEGEMTSGGGDPIDRMLDLRMRFTADQLTRFIETHDIRFGGHHDLAEFERGNHVELSDLPWFDRTFFDRNAQNK